MSTQPSFAPSRRRFGALLAAGAAVALPVLPVIAAPEDKDAALVAHSHTVRRASKRADAAWRLVACRTDRWRAATPKHPTWVPGPDRTAHADYPAAELRKDMDEALAGPNGLEQDDPWIAERWDRIGRMEVYEAERDRLRRRFRIDAAIQAATRADERLKEAAVQLTFMPPTTIAGLTAKARASMSLLDQIGSEQWIDDLVGMVIRETVMIGGAA